MTSIRMGGIAVSTNPGEELVALGLGSCIALALIDRASGVAGLAHIVLPESDGRSSEPGTFADLAVPALVSRVLEAGGRSGRLEAVLAGGARMLEPADSSELDVGAHNEAAVRKALSRAGIRVAAAATGGERGRAMRVTTGASTVTVREAGLGTFMLWDGAGAQSLSGASR